MYAESYESNQNSANPSEAKEEKTFSDRALEVATTIGTIAASAFVSGIFLAAGQRAFATVADRNKPSGDVVPLKKIG
jgi:hypothetical protein